MQEIELKLNLLEDNPRSLHEHTLINHYSIEPPVTFDLATTYYDTTDYDLLKLGIALRIREEEDGKFVQTVKTKGKETQGLHQREEWHSDLSSKQIDLSLIEPPELRKQLETIAKKHKIIPLFQTRFSRTKWLLALPNQCEVELVMDLGEVAVEKASVPIQEIELELIKGKQVDCLFELAASIASAMPVNIENKSKAWRGYQLHQAIAAGKVYQELRDSERQSAEFFMEQAALFSGSHTKH
ncbi:MAG: adenylate cyclase [Gammaproteobacteria bacterium]|jgi:inorganic triphosphatase YgiF|nr:adenylate cyclase [Gammaproteobacteria bacterium]